ncbi:MAG: myo-inositol catabolism protein IolS [Pirellulaceae bacterium]|jgi:myo-inositol catabolism protein IolS
MKFVNLPHTSLSVSQLCFGCWGIISDFHWGDRSEGDATASINAALDAGINYFDTAAAYGDGASETLLGKVFAGKRDKVVLASKVRADEMQPAQIIAACEQSLQRLNTDYLDLYQTHWADPNASIAESWAALEKLKAAGKVREIGVCNAGIGDLNALCAGNAPVTNQLPYNLIWRIIEHEILPKCRQENIGILVYSPLMHGMLADKYKSAAEVPDGRARSRHFTTEREKARHGEAGCETETFATIDTIREICSAVGRTMADVALAWTAAQPGVSAVIVGVRNPEQLAQNIATLENPLDQEVIEQLNAATAGLNGTLGNNPDMWQGTAGSRYR